MDRYQAPARLEWWANRSTCLGTFTVEADITWSAESGWDARAVATPPMTEDDREGFAFLMALDPFFTLRLPDDSAFPVEVEVDGDGLRLTADEGDLPGRQPTHFEP